jgi:hypothetical protein
MPTVKENIIKEIQSITNEDILLSLQNLIHSMRDAEGYIELNPEQKNAIEEGIEDYKNGRFLSTDDLFNDLDG